MHHRFHTVHPAFGALSSVVKDNVYQLEKGIIFTSPWVVTRSTVRFHGMILLTARALPFAVRVGETTKNYHALAIKPLTERGLRAENVQLISVHVKPEHPDYPAFRAISAPGLLPLPRDAFAHLDLSLDRAYRGELTIEQANALLESVIATTLPFLPKTKPSDPRIERAIELLGNGAHPSLTDLARAMGLSYYRMSHLFKEAMGIPLRTYLLAQKVQKMSSYLGSGLPLTAVAHACGFTDSAHMSRVTQKFHGAPPAYFFNNERVRVFCWKHPPSVSYKARSHRTLFGEAAWT